MKKLSAFLICACLLVIMSVVTAHCNLLNPYAPMNAIAAEPLEPYNLWEIPQCSRTSYLPCPALYLSPRCFRISLLPGPLSPDRSGYRFPCLSFPPAEMPIQEPSAEAAAELVQPDSPAGLPVTTIHHSILKQTQSAQDSGVLLHGL